MDRSLSRAIRQQFKEARDAGLAKRHADRLRRAAMAEKNTRDPFGPWLNGFSYEMAFDGNAWTISKGEDFDVAPSTVAAKLREEWERRYGRLDVRVDGEKVYVRHVPAKR